MNSEELLRFERDLWRSGVHAVAGVDEAGRGPLAGPVVAAAVILPEGHFIAGVEKFLALLGTERPRGE